MDNVTREVRHLIADALPPLPDQVGDRSALSNCRGAHVSYMDFEGLTSRDGERNGAEQKIVGPARPIDGVGEQCVGGDVTGDFKGVGRCCRCMSNVRSPLALECPQ